MFRQLHEHKRRQFALAMQSRRGLAVLAKASSARGRTAIPTVAEHLERIQAWYEVLRRLQGRTRGWWRSVEQAETDAELEAALDQLVPRLEENRQAIIASADEAGIGDELRHHLVTETAERLSAAAKRTDQSRSTYVQAAWLADACREISRLRAHLVGANQGLVHLALNRYVGLGLSRSDLAQEANIGLMRAIDKFDVERGLRFNTYAMWWIRQAARRALSNQSRTIRVPVHALEARHAVLMTRARLMTSSGHRPSVEELARETGIVRDEVERLILLAQEPLSLEAPCGADSEQRLQDFVAAPEAEDSEEASQRRTRRAQVEALLSELTPREQTVMRLRFGFEGSRDECTLEEVGAALGVTRERARQIVAKCLKKMQRVAARRRLDLDELN